MRDLLGIPAPITKTDRCGCWLSNQNICPGLPVRTSEHTNRDTKTTCQSRRKDRRFKSWAKSSQHFIFHHNMMGKPFLFHPCFITTSQQSCNISSNHHHTLSLSGRTYLATRNWKTPTSKQMRFVHGLPVVDHNDNNACQAGCMISCRRIISSSASPVI